MITTIIIVMFVLFILNDFIKTVRYVLGFANSNPKSFIVCAIILVGMYFYIFKGGF